MKRYLVDFHYCGHTVLTAIQINDLHTPEFTKHQVIYKATIKALRTGLMNNYPPENWAVTLISLDEGKHRDSSINLYEKTKAQENGTLEIPEPHYDFNEIY